MNTATSRHESDRAHHASARQTTAAQKATTTTHASRCYFVDADDTETARRILQQTAALFSTTPYATLDHDPLWLLQYARDTPKRLRFLLLEHNKKVQGFIPLFEHPALLGFLRVGDVPVLWRRIQRRQIIGGPLLAADLSRTQQEFHVARLLRQLRRQMNGTAAIFLFGTPHESALGNMLTRRSPVSEDFYVIPYGPSYQRRLIDFPEDFEAYLATLSKITRKDLRRTRRKCQNAFSEQGFSVQTFTTVQEVPTYVEDAGDVAQQTYQWKLYGSGLTRTDQLEFAARQGWLRCYVLYIGGRPAAFQTGYLYRDTYYAYETGYLPQWSKLQIGIFLLTEIFIELLTSEQKVKHFDFLQGEDLSKARLSTVARTEQDYYLIPRTLRGSLLALTLKTSLALAEVAKRAGERTGIKPAVKRLLKNGLRRPGKAAA